MPTQQFPFHSWMPFLSLLPSLQCPPYLSSHWWPWWLVLTWQEMPGQVQPPLVFLLQGTLLLERMLWRPTWQTMTLQTMTWEVMPGLRLSGLETSLLMKHSESRAKASLRLFPCRPC